MNKNGLLMCTAYAFPPNALHYCGPEKQENLHAYRKTRLTDQGLVEILQKFETLYPYLVLIAHENNIKDPFDERVVEAYWLGNSLLHNVSMNQFHIHLSDTLHLKKRLKKKDLTILMGKLDDNAVPNHTYHVLNIFTRTGHHSITHTIETMDNCRIGWGKIIRDKHQSTRNANSVFVETQPLVLHNGKLTLGKPIIKAIAHSPAPDSPLSTANFISYHWNTFCSYLTDKQVNNISFYTKKAIDLANKTI